MGKLCGAKGEGFRCVLTGVVGVGSWRWAILCACFEGHSWFSLVGPELEVETKIEKLTIIEHVLILGQLLQKLRVRILLS